MAKEQQKSDGTNKPTPEDRAKDRFVWKKGDIVILPPEDTEEEQETDN